MTDGDEDEDEGEGVESDEEEGLGAILSPADNFQLRASRVVFSIGSPTTPSSSKTSA